MSLLLPVIAGAAIGGKRGAAAGFVGAGESQIKREEAEEKTAREDERYESRRVDALEDYGAKLEMKEAIEGGEGRKAERDFEQFKRKEDYKNDSKRRAAAQEEYDKAQPVIEIGKDVSKDLEGMIERREVGGRVSYQLKGGFTASDIGKLRSRMRLWAMDIVKQKQGSRPSDFDVKMVLKAVQGDFSSSPQDTLDLINQTLGDMERIQNYNLKVASGDRSSVTEEEKAAYDRAMSKGSDVAFASAVKAKRGGLKKGDVAKLIKSLENRGYSLSQEDIDLIWGDE
jgi:hypothetical protein